MPPSGVSIVNTGDLTRLIDDHHKRMGQPPGALVANPSVLGMMRREFYIPDPVRPTGFTAASWHGVDIMLSKDLPKDHVYAMNCRPVTNHLGFFSGGQLMVTLMGSRTGGGYDHIRILNPNAAKTRNKIDTVLLEHWEPIMSRSYGLEFACWAGGEVVQWDHCRNLFKMSLYSPPLLEADILYASKSVAVSAEMVARAARKKADATALDDAVRDELHRVGREFWTEASAAFTSARFIGHDPPAPDSPAGIFAAAFG